MSANSSVRSSDQKTDLTSAIVKRLLQVGVGVALQAVIMFLAVGRLDWLAGWVYLAVYVGGIVFLSFYLLPRDPELIAERGQVKEDTKGWDKWLATIIGLLCPLLTLLVAGLDRRFGWTLPLSPALRMGVLGIGVLGYALVLWAMVSNKFFSAVVRIQKDRGHSVVTDGPYRYVRHPGYVGLFIFNVVTPVWLGSLWGLIPAVIAALLVVVRTALEDRTLMNELDGYRDYAQEVRFRLLPGVW
jgi:protein-S-isoprenylcysteine O-methyltransferase Ste14